MNYFGTDAFLESAAEALFPHRPCQVVHGGVDGRTYRLLRVGRRIVGDLPYLDFHEPVESSGHAVEPVPWLAKVDRGTVPVEGWARRLEAGEQAAPLVAWRGFDDWQAFEAHVKGSSKKLFSDVRRRVRRLEEALGPVERCFGVSADGLLEACLMWKSQQYRRSGLPDLLSSDRVLGLFRALARRDALHVSAVLAGGRPVAVHVGAVHEGRFYYWVPAYDPTLSALSPGKVLNLALLEESWRAGHDVFDLLLGDEAYKFEFATHVRRVGPAGCPPLPLRLRAAAHERATRILGQSARLTSVARGLRRRVTEWRVS